MKTRNPKFEIRKRNSGFTLIEMLAVCAIIAILTGILYPALRTIRDGPKKAQTRGDIKKLEVAIQAFYNEYGVWPPTPTVADGDFYCMLNGNRSPWDGTTFAGTYAANNPRGVRFVELSKKQVNSANMFLDPWNNPYVICMDNGSYAFGPGNWIQSWWGDISSCNPGVPAPANDGIIMSRVNGAYNAKRSIGIFSYGPNGQNNDAQGPEYDDIASWY